MVAASLSRYLFTSFFFFYDPAPTEIYTLSLHDALPIFAPSVSSVYQAAPDLADTVMLAISQSGASPDLLATVSSARAAGAWIVALVNEEASALAQLADDLIPLRAGAERSVAATKSYIASLAAIVQLVAHWASDASLVAALSEAPALLLRAWELDWSAAVARL